MVCVFLFLTFWFLLVPSVIQILYYIVVCGYISSSIVSNVDDDVAITVAITISSSKMEDVVSLSPSTLL